MIEKLQPLRYTKLIIIPEKSFSRITSVSSRRSRRLEGVLGVRGIPGILASRDWVLLFHHAVMIHKSERWKRNHRKNFGKKRRKTKMNCYDQEYYSSQLDVSRSFALLISIEFFFSFRFPLIFQLHYQFPAFFQAAFQANEHPPVQTFPEQVSNLIR